MIVYGATLQEVTDVVAKASAEHYAGNIAVRTGEDRSNSRGGRATFTLRALDTSDAGPGAKGSASWSSSGTGPNGLRRTIAACWHAHYDVLAALFAAYPDARVNTAMARYEAAQFHDTAMVTAWRNVGAPIAPITPLECCECDHTGWRHRVALDRMTAS